MKNQLILIACGEQIRRRSEFGWSEMCGDTPLNRIEFFVRFCMRDACSVWLCASVFVYVLTSLDDWVYAYWRDGKYTAIIMNGNERFLGNNTNMQCKTRCRCTLRDCQPYPCAGMMDHKTLKAEWWHYIPM